MVVNNAILILTACSFASMNPKSEFMRHQKKVFFDESKQAKLLKRRNPSRIIFTYYRVKSALKTSIKLRLHYPGRWRKLLSSNWLNFSRPRCFRIVESGVWQGLQSCSGVPSHFSTTCSVWPGRANVFKKCTHTHFSSSCSLKKKGSELNK